MEVSETVANTIETLDEVNTIVRQIAPLLVQLATQPTARNAFIDGYSRGTNFETYDKYSATFGGNEADSFEAASPYASTEPKSRIEHDAHFVGVSLGVLKQRMEERL